MLKKMLKKMLSENSINKIKKIKNLLNYWNIKMLRTNNFMIRVSLFFNNYYLNEHKTFLNGSYQYEKAKKNHEANIYNLRRNIHRLEKGLLMIPMRKEFGLNFIENTVNNFIKLDHKKYSDISMWGLNILNNYFEVTESQNQHYLNAKKTYEKNITLSNNCNYKPYNVTKKTHITYEEFKEMNLLRKSTRWFKQKKVEHEKLIKALDIAKLAPSGCNRQPFRYIITNDFKKAQRIASISGGTGGWSQNIPAIAIIIGKQSSFSGTFNRHSIYIDSTLTIMPFILALETLGLSSCIINWLDIQERINKIKKEIVLAEDECIITSIAIGYPNYEGKVAYSKRMNTENLVEFI